MAAMLGLLAYAMRGAAGPLRPASRGIDMADRLELAADLEQLVTGALTAQAFRDKWESRWASMTGLGRIWAYLEHYLGDGDIRDKDAWYNAMQNDEMSKLIALLREDAPAEALERIHFLGRTDD